MKRLSLLSRHDGFTLTEVLVSSALIVAIMALMFTTIDQTRRTIESTTSRVAQFQSARVAFESMIRTLSQATLNTYYDMDLSVTTKNPLGFRRQSDLHFISGKAYDPKLLQKAQNDDTGGEDDPRTAAHFPGHAVFFQAPLGITAEEEQSLTNTTERRYRGLTNLLSTVGFYVRWNEDKALPPFMGTNNEYVPPRHRFRLMQVQQPAETNMIYADSNYTTLNASGLSARPGVGYKYATDWVKVAVGLKALPKEFKLPDGVKARTDYSRVLAENVVAIIVLPKITEKDRVAEDRLDDLTEDYEYDSCPEQAYEGQKREFKVNDPLLNLTEYMANSGHRRIHRQLNQLPPILQVTMVAIDEPSGQKLADYSEEPPELTTGLFTKVGKYEDFLRDLGDPAKPSQDSLVYRLSNPDGTLPTPSLKYRVFTSDVVLRGSKWSK